ncbi:MAG: hypothetical protein HQK75_15480 [Candidatus Magnetomorum sp.]|nr:hypothetical protein [Candidatus Magnetomorum sp.]
MQLPAKKIFICLLLTGLIFSEMSFAATPSLQSNSDAVLSKKVSTLNQTDVLYIALNSKPGIRRQLTNSIDDLVNGQAEIQNTLKGKASKAGARRIIQTIDELSENKADKLDIENAVQSFKMDVDNSVQALRHELSTISSTLVALQSQVSPQQRIQILAEIKTEQQNIKERIAEMSDRIQKINTQYATNADRNSRNHQSDFSKLADTQSEINGFISTMKQDLKGQKDLANRHLKIILFFFLLIIMGIAGWVYFYIHQQKRAKAEIFTTIQAIVKEQYDHLIHQLYVEEHEDGRLTAEDLKKMSEQVKKRVIRQNWAKRKVEERPAFI